MSHKVHPKSFRLGYTKDWESKWFNRKKYKQYLKQDYFLRNLIIEELKEAGLEKIEIKRSSNLLKIIIHSSRPGIVIGRGGAGVQELKNKIINKIFKGQTKGVDVKIDIQEIKKADTHAEIVAQNIAEQLKRRMSFRRAMKRSIEKVMRNPEVKGIKISLSGRLGGAEMARSEWLKKGEMPLHNLRADIDYSLVNANTNYGIIGVKVWIYKGEKFEQ